ncbi:hypothetical protein JCM11641_001658 [Rhodosporidiobolus odoratus]
MYGVPPPPPRASTPPRAKIQELSSTPTSSNPASSTSTTQTGNSATAPKPASRATGVRPARKSENGNSIFQDLLSNPLSLATDRRYYWLIAGTLLAWETLVCVWIIRRVRYTEIDFSTYLQQVQHFLKGERDYSKIQGESGKCYYPALHLYLYSLFYRLVQPVFGSQVDLGTGVEVPGRIIEGKVRLAQYAFAGIYVATLGLVFVVYSRNKRLPQYLLPLLSISKRLHSIYVLRMFNDCFAMLLFWAAVVMYSAPGQGKLARLLGKGGIGERGRWALGTLILSAGLGIKMNLLLPLPGLFYLLFVYQSPLTLIGHGFLLLASQSAFALPFIRPPPGSISTFLDFPSSSAALRCLEPARIYLTQAFDLNRGFLFEFTQNWRFLQDEEVFLSASFQKLLLVGHVVGLGLFAVRWAEEEGGVEAILGRAWKKWGARPARRGTTPERTTTLLLTPFLVGTLFARSLHPQFYSWFAWMGVWMTFGCGIYEGMQCLMLLSLLEYGFAIYPSTVNSSLGLVLSLLVILAGVYYGRPCELDDFDREGSEMESPDIGESTR